MGRATCRCFRLIEIDGVFHSIPYKYSCVDPSTPKYEGDQAFGLPYYYDESEGQVVSGSWSKIQGWSWYQGCQELTNFILTEDDGFVDEENLSKIYLEVSNA